MFESGYFHYYQARWLLPLWSDMMGSGLINSWGGLMVYIVPLFHLFQWYPFLFKLLLACCKIYNFVYVELWLSEKSANFLSMREILLTFLENRWANSYLLFILSGGASSNWHPGNLPQTKQTLSLMSSVPLQIPWGAHNVWGGGELVHYWDHAASPSTVDHILCSGSTCVFCAEESEVDFHLLRRALAPPLLS